MRNEKSSAFRRSLQENVDILLASLILALVTFSLAAPLLTEGTVLFGDFVPTLRLNDYFRVNYPLWSNRNNFNFVGPMRFPYLLIFYLPFCIVGAPAEVFFKSMIVGALVMSGLSMYVASRYFLRKAQANRKVSFLCAILASLLYAFNPWVMDRVEHIFLLVTYCLLPLIFLLSVKTFNQNGAGLGRILVLVLLSTVASTSPHSVFFILFLIASLYVYFALLDGKQFLQKTRNFALFLILFVLVNAFWLLPVANYSLSSGPLIPDYVLHLDDVRVFSRNGNLLNVFRLVAYWWPKVSYSFEAYPLNALWIFASSMIPIVCFLAVIFHKRNKIVVYFSLLSMVVVFLTAGLSSPLPSLYEWLVFDAPIFAPYGWLLRDPNKWSLLLPLAYSILLAFACFGILRLIDRIRKVALRKVFAATFITLIFASVFIYVTPAGVNYFGGPFHPVKIPSEIFDVNRWLENDSASYNVLWLPSYVEYGASWVYGNLSGSFELDSSGKPTFDPDSKYARGYINYFGSVLAENRSDYAADYLNPLNVRYVILHDDLANPDYANSLFQGLKRQKDLSLIKNDGSIYVFENQGWTNVTFKSFQNNMAIVGGFDKSVSLNALKDLNFSESSVLYADQIALKNYLDFNTFALSGDLLSDALPFYLNESLVIAPFDYVKRHKPSECWSKASTSDLSSGSFHPYLKQFGVECWDFDYDKGIVFTWASSSMLNLSFNLASSESYDFCARVFENGAGGKVAVFLDGKPLGVVDTQSQTDRFVWKLVGVSNMTSGTHSLALQNVEGLNAVNLFALIPQQKARDITHEFESNLQNKDVLYEFEAESDMTVENASVDHNDEKGFSSGAAVKLVSDSKVSKNIELACDGNYTLTVRGSGNLRVNIDGSSHEYAASLTDFGWSSSSQMRLDSGSHSVEVSNPQGNSSAYLDILLLFKSGENSRLWSKPDTPATTRIISVREIDKTKFVIEVETDKPFMLSFACGYDAAWTASYGGRVSGALWLFGVVNGFWIDAVGKVVVTVELRPQWWFYAGSVISSVTLVVCVGIIFYCRWRKRTAGARKQLI